MRRFPRVRALAAGFAVVALVSAVLAGGTTPAYAVAAGIIVPPGGTFPGNNPDETFTYTYSPISVVHEPGDETTETPTCMATNGATSGHGFISGGTFNPGTTTVTCSALEDPADDHVSDTTSFIVIVTDQPVFDSETVGPYPDFALEPASQTKTADGSDTATFTFPTFPITAHEPAEPSEPVNVSCASPFAGEKPLTNPITLTAAPPLGPRHEWDCTATDTTAGESNNVNFARVILTVQDEPTVLTNPGNQAATADATDTAFVSYPMVTPSESPSGERDNTIAGCFADNGATSTNFFASSGTFNVGVTTVRCDANDIPNAPGKDGTNPPGESATEITFTVAVADQPVTLTVPPTQLAQATSSSGATVSFGPVTAAENGEAETIGPNCSADKPAATSADGFISAGNFPVGGTTVTCTATDNADGTPSATIDTTPSWNGSHGVQSFGYQDTATYGQTVTVPATDTKLDSFTFYMKQPTGLLFRGEVYAWDNTANHATGSALYESSATHTTDSTVFQPITFNTGGINLTAGAHYVLFATISKDYAADAGAGRGPWGAITTDAYSGGDFFYVNNRGDTSQWTSGPWNRASGCQPHTAFCLADDLAFKASFSSAPPTQSFTVIVTNTPCATLAGCNLHGLDLTNANLSGADLSSGTDLSNANLNKADLSGANLSFANLSGANLNKADLTGANLTGAITTGANFNKVTWSNTTCPDGTNSSASTPETCVGHL
jgi:Pentapeptide repeats (8 copies)